MIIQYSCISWSIHNMSSLLCCHSSLPKKKKEKKKNEQQIFKKHQNQRQVSLRKTNVFRLKKREEGNL